MALQGFVESEYLAAKLAALQTETAWVGKTTEQLKTFLANAGFTPESHYQEYGWTEGLAPNTLFNAAEYKLAKATDMFNKGLVGGGTPYVDIAAAQAAFDAAWPYDSYLHYVQYGSSEGVNPSNAFDESSYLASKLAALQADATTAADWTGKTVADVQAAFAAAGLSALAHYEDYGKTEGIAVTEVPAGEAVTPGGGVVPGETITLTNGTDVATSNIFNAPMVYVPDGSDRILSLQDEDVLTGTAGRTDNTLNVTMGNRNADEGTTAITTPYLNNIQNINIDWTGNTTTLDLRNADATTAIHIDRVTSDATAITVDNIGTPAADLRVADSASDDVAILFNFKQGVLTGDETLSLQLDDVLAASVTQDARGAGVGIEGFEAVNLNAINGVDLAALSVNEMETLTITGSGALKIATLTPTAPVSTAEYNQLGAIAGINNPGAVGLLDLDASAFTGELTLDITNSLGGFADPSNSGAIVHGVVTGGSGNDAFWSSVGVASTSATNRDVIDGGAGDNSLILVDGDISGDASITNVETLELRNQTVLTDVHNIDFDAFDDSLTTVIMRDEDPDAAAATFNLNDMGVALAASGLELRHSVTEGVAAGFNNATVRVRLADASGTDDTVAIKVVNDRNTETEFNYTLNFDGQESGVGAIENVSIDDADTEDNTVVLTASQEHTGTITLSGGVAGDAYTVTSSLVASTVDASAQLSDLRLTVGDAVAPIVTVDQDIMLGSGDDILTFRNIDDFNTADSISDVGGVDTVRAAFSDDAALTLTGIENLHILATDNVTLGMANADIENLVILADIAADGDADASPVTAEPFNLVPATTDIITLTDSNLTELNFFADLDNNDDNTAANIVAAKAAALVADPTWTGIGSTVLGDAAYKGVIADESTVANFNGITLANNTATDLTVNINSSLDDVIYGATAYNLGQLTAHGITTIDIQISDEDVTAGLGTNALTTISNIFARNMTSLTVTAAEDVTLGTVSGSALNNSLITFDASNVGGELIAAVISLGNNAQVTLGEGDNVFSALGSAGKDIVITAGDGDNTITGSGQDDTITTGAGFDTVAGDRGDNVITTGAGNDVITAKDGNDTYDVGTGIDVVTDNLSTAIDGTLATNTVSMSGGVTQLFIDVTGNGVGGTDVDQMLAVGAGSDLTLSWTGANLVTASAVLDGRLADVNNVLANDANSNLDLISAAGLALVSGAGGNDVTLVTSAVAAISFSGGTGNDAAVGGILQDIFSGGTGADKLVMQNTAAADSVGDLIVVADGDSLAASYDQVVGFDITTGTTVAAVVAGGAVAGDDYLDLAFAGAFTAAANVNGTDVSGIESHTIAATGEVTFDTDDTTAFAAVAVGTGTGQLSLSAALAYLATNMNGSAESVFFAYDVTGDGATADDSTFIFQDGAADSVIELVGVTGLNLTGAVGVAVIGDIVIV